MYRTPTNTYDDDNIPNIDLPGNKNKDKDTVELKFIQSSCTNEKPQDKT